MATGRPLLGERIVKPLRVWLWNGEDPADELRRRVTAAAKFHGIQPHELDGRLFIDSGRDVHIKIATMRRDGLALNEEAICDLIDHAKAVGLDVLSFDPFVSLHAVPENDNGAVDAVVKALGRVAGAAGVAIEVVHHSRKPPSGPHAMATTVDDARGAGSLIAATRHARTLNRMTRAEAEGLGIPVADHWRYVRLDDGKANMSPPASMATWRRLESVELPNGDGFEPGDEIGAIAAWTPPDAFGGVSVSDLPAIRDALASGAWKASDKAEDWAGVAVASALGLDVGPPRKGERTASQEHARARVRTMINTWLREGVLRKVEMEDPKNRRPAPFVVPSDYADE